ncbi:MAG: 2'-5' RNA ligase family protein, partial [Dehalococcoidia bacterium]
MNAADRATAERHQEIWGDFHRRPVVSAWTGRMPLPPEVTAAVGFVIPVDGAAVRRSLQNAVSRLEATGCVTAFPPDYWHITIVPPAYLTSGEPAPPRLLPESFVGEALEKGRRAVQTPGSFEVAVRGLNAFRDVAVAVPYDGGRGRELAGALRAAIPELPERYPDGHDSLPHISLTQYARDDRLEGLVEIVQRERERDFGSFRAHRL